MTDLIWSFAPWVVFLLTDRLASFPVALAAGGLVAIGVLGRAISRKHVHMLDIANIVYFIVVGAALVITQPGDLDTWGRYAQGGAHGFLTVLVLGSVVVGHPFTAAYARERVPEHVWHSKEFHAFNQRLSLAWGIAFLIGTSSLIVAGATDSFPFILRLVVPFGALALALLYTQQATAARTTKVS
jgi:predicted ferric reductase